MMSPGVRRYINLPRATRLGFEFVWDQQLAKTLAQQIAASYTRGQNDVTKMPLPEIEPLEVRYALHGSFWKNRVQPFVRARHSARQARVATEYAEHTTDGFFVMNTGLVARPQKHLNVTLGINNLFNTQYREPLSRFISKTQPLTAPGRSFFVMLSMRY